MFVLKSNNKSKGNDDNGAYRKGFLMLSFLASLRIIYYITNMNKNKKITN